MKNFSIEIQDATLNGYQLDTANFQQFTIFNSIDQLGITCEILYNDVTDVKGKMPLKGGEELTIHLIDQFGGKLKKTMILRSVKQVKKLNDENAVIFMTFITKEGFFLGVNRAYDSFFEKTISEIIKKYLPTIDDKKPTTDKLSIVIPGFSQTKAIKYALEFTNNYIVFEGAEKFIMSPIEMLLVPSSKSYSFTSDNEKAKDYLIDSKEVQIFDANNEAYENIYNNVYKAYDPNTKSIISSTKKIDELQTKVKTLGTGENFSSGILQTIKPKVSMLPYHPGVMDIDRKADSLFNKKYEVLVNGNLDLKVGDTINIMYMERYNTEPNKMLNGLYLITKLAHHIGVKDFYTKLEIQKNAYFKGGITSNSVL